MKYEPLKSGYYYHIFNRGNNKEDIFIEEMNYTYFLNLLKKHITPIANIWSYCLLKNHFHLLLYTKEDPSDKNISQAFSNFFNSYSKSINKKHNRTGSLFQDRFKRKLIEKESYLRNLIVYINTNPILHNFVSDIYKYNHSSFLSLISDKKTLLSRNEVIGLFDDKENFIYYIENQILNFDENKKSLILE